MWINLRLKGNMYLFGINIIDIINIDDVLKFRKVISNVVLIF